jgi:hypothetical protein
MLGLRKAMRQLRKAPGFTSTAVITLALGIGATTAIFTLVHQVMLKSLPVAKPEELWRIGDKIRCCNWGGYTQGSDGDFSLFSWEAYKNFRAHTPEFVDLAALQAGNAPLGVRRAGSKVQADTRNGQYVSGNFFKTFGVRPWIGRLMTDTDDQAGAPPVAVMSFHVWQDKYGSDPSAIGASYQINGHPFTVIGVAAPGFYGAKLAGWGMPDFWLPATTELLINGATARLKRPNGNFLDLIGRVRPGVNPKSLEAKLKVEFHDWLASHVPDMEPGEKQLWRQQTLHLIPGGAGVAQMRNQYEARTKTAADSGSVCAAGGLRESGESDAGTRIEGSSANLNTGGAGRFATAPDREGTGRIRDAGDDWRRPGHRSGVCRDKADSAACVSDRQAESLRPDRRDTVLAGAAVHTGSIDRDRNHFRDSTRVDDFACRSGGGAARGQSFGGRQTLAGTEGAGSGAGGDVAGVAVGGSSAGPELAKSGASEFRVRDAGQVYRLD